jgi:uncharacterized membrane protein
MARNQEDHPDAPVPCGHKDGLDNLQRVVLRRADTVRKILVAVIALLIFREIISCLTGVVGAAPALIGGIIAVAVQMYCSRLAKANFRYYGYLLIPTLIFAVIPAALKLREVLGSQRQDPAARFLVIAPEAIGFALPIILLLVAYWVIGRRIPLVGSETTKDRSFQPS